MPRRRSFSDAAPRRLTFGARAAAWALAALAALLAGCAAPASVPASAPAPQDATPGPTGPVAPGAREPDAPADAQAGAVPAAPECVERRPPSGVGGFFEMIQRRYRTVVDGLRQRPPGEDDAAAPADPNELPFCDGIAARPNYRLDVEAPEPLAKLIRSNTLLGRWQRRADFDPSQMPLFLRRARTEVPELLAAEGYFEPEVSVDGDAQRVRIAVVPGPRVTVSQVELTFSGPLGAPDFEAPREGIRKGWLLPEGSFFRAADWDKAKQELLESARNAGFLRARLVESEARVTLETTAAQLRVELESGEPVQFGDLVVNGLQRYPQSIVEGLRGFSPGEPYSAAQIVRLQMRLSGSGYFNTVNVRPDMRALEKDPSLQQVPIRVDVSEANSKRLSLGGGYNTDGGISALIGWSNKNVLGQGLQFGSGLELDQQQQIVFATLDTPYDLSGGRWQLGAKAWHKDVFNDITDSTSLFVSRGRRIGDYDHAVSLQYQYEIQNVVYSDTLQTNDTSQAVVLGYAATLRRLDSLVNPTRGYIATGQVSGASQSLGSDSSFARAYGFGWLLVPMPQVTEAAGTLVLRGEAGVVFASSTSGIPSQNLFRTGGMRSVRGYASQSLGVPVGAAILSGRYLLVGSVEYQHPIDRELAWAVFYDRGNATDSLSNFSTVAGYGAGIRYRTPVGPLSLDLAWGEEVRKFRLHFAIGLVF